MNTLIRRTLGLLAVLALLLAAIIFAPTLRSPSFWQGAVEPGHLSGAHRFLENNCSACHVQLKGVDDAACISCHANDTALLQRQPTAFHANIRNCNACHIEHGGSRTLRAPMNHEALARIGLELLASAPQGSEARSLSSHLFAHDQAAQTGSGNGALLDCFGCHQSRDRHWGQFGRDCGTCHDTAQWTLAQYRHPSPSSTECAQCHRPPPSHSMGHFEMVSKRVSGEEHARIDQCYLCHQTTSWNDIRAVGVYRHH